MSINGSLFCCTHINDKLGPLEVREFVKPLLKSRYHYYVENQYHEMEHRIQELKQQQKYLTDMETSVAGLTIDLVQNGH